MPYCNSNCSLTVYCIKGYDDDDDDDDRGVIIIIIHKFRLTWRKVVKLQGHVTEKKSCGGHKPPGLKPLSDRSSLSPKWGTKDGLHLFVHFVCFWHIFPACVELSAPKQVIAWKDSTPKWPIMCRAGRTLLTHSLRPLPITASYSDFVAPEPLNMSALGLI